MAVHRRYRFRSAPPPPEPGYGQVFGFWAGLCPGGRGLIELEPSTEKRLKYLDFVDIYADLDDNERQLYTQLYPHEVATMSGFAQRFLEKGREEGMQQGMQCGEARILTAQLRLPLTPVRRPLRMRHDG